MEQCRCQECDPLFKVLPICLPRRSAECPAAPCCFQVEVTDGSGATPLLHAVYKGNTDVVAMLLDSKADVDRVHTLGSASSTSVNIVCKVDTDGNSALMVASHYGHEDVVQMLIRCHASLDKPNTQGRTALMEVPLQTVAMSSLGMIHPQGPCYCMVSCAIPHACRLHTLPHYYFHS